MSTLSLIKTREISVKRISSSPYQTRISIRDVNSLAKNIAEYGLQHPITVRRISKGKYELISGARRLEAVKSLGWKKISAVIKEVSDSEAATLCLSENLQRANLNAIEEARGYKMLIDLFDYTHEKISKIVGKSRTFITNSLSLLKLDKFLQACIVCGELTISHVRIINMAPDYIEKFRLADIVMDWRLTIKELHDIVKKLNDNKQILSWRRVIPISKIKIPVSSFTSKYPDNGVVIVDSGLMLYGGLERILRAREKGKVQVEAEVVYFADWLNSSESCSLIEFNRTKNITSNNSYFSNVLAELIGDDEKMYNLYPVHYIPMKEDYLFLQPHLS
jgi:ParB family chromosome partitioning protein